MLTKRNIRILAAAAAVNAGLGLALLSPQLALASTCAARDVCSIQYSVCVTLTPADMTLACQQAAPGCTVTATSCLVHACPPFGGLHCIYQ
jgi:hypothetical protein